MQKRTAAIEDQEEQPQPYVLKPSNGFAATEPPTAASSASLAGLSAAKFAAQRFKQASGGDFGEDIAGSSSSDAPSIETAHYLLQQKAAHILAQSARPSLKTGSLFATDNAQLLPPMFRPGFTALAMTADSIQAQIEAFKPMIEQIIYWENLTNTLIWSLSIVFTWILAKLGFGFGWVIILLFILGGAFKRNLARLRRKIRHDVKVFFAIKKLVTDKETVEWLNSFLAKFWYNYEPGLSQTIADSVNPILESARPGYLDYLGLTTFTLGSEAPRIEAIRTYPRTEQDVLMMDWEIVFSPFDEDDLSKRAMAITNKRNSKIELTIRLGKGMASFPIPILLKEVELRGTMRVHLTFSPTFPHIKTVEFGFLEKPLIDFILRPLKGMDLMDTPGLSGFLTETIDSSLEAAIVDPNKITINLEEMMGASTVDKPVGIICLAINEGRGLKNKELTGLSDPYVKVHIGPLSPARTQIVHESLNPVWKETHYIILYASQLAQVANKSDVFSLEVLDWNNMKKDKCMGVTRSLALSRWLMLLEGGKEVKEELMEKKNKEVEEGGDGAEDATNHHPGKTTCAADDTASPSSPSETTTHLTPDEKDALIAEWGHPSGGPDIWKKLYTDDDYKKLAGGDIRLNMLYFKVPEVARTVATLEDLMDAPTGILKIKVHQAKDLPSKSANAFVVMELGNGKEVARTPIRKRTNAPVWELGYDIFVTDIESTRITYKVKDSSTSAEVLMGKCVIDVKSTLLKESSANDWYRLTGGNAAAGKLQISVKYQPVSLESDSTSTATTVKRGAGRENPKGYLRVDVMNAKGLLNVETLTFSKSDPYCRVKVSGEEIGKTNVVENSLDPTWEKDCYSVMFSSADLLDFDLFDYQNLGKDRSLGSAPSLKLQDFISDVDIINFLQDIDPTVVIDPAFDGDRRNSANNLNNSKLASEVMARLEKDGFKIVHTSRLSTDVWCPIYLKKLDVVSSADAGSNLSSSTSKESKQKGHLHFKLSYLPVVPSKVLKYERSKGDSTRTSQILAPAPSNGANSGGGTVKEDAQVSPSLTPPVAELPKSALITLDWVASVFKQYPSGILQILVHEGRGMSRHGNMYAQVICDSAAVSEAPFKSSVLKNTLDPVWNESAFVFIRDITDDSVTIVVKVESGEKNKPDHIIGVYRCNGLALANLIGKQNEWVNLTDPEETKTSTRMSDGGFGRLRVTMSYFPVAVEQSARASISKDSKGSLQLDLLEAVDLEAVDQGGASDPYCVVSLGLDKLHKTKVHKKTLNPVFNESLSIPIKSLLSTKINIEVVDYNLFQKHVVLGTLSLPLSTHVRPGEPLVKEFKLENARCGRLKLRLIYTPDDASSGDTPSTRNSLTLLTSPNLVERASKIQDQSALSKIGKSLSNLSLSEIAGTKARTSKDIKVSATVENVVEAGALDMPETSSHTSTSSTSERIDVVSTASVVGNLQQLQAGEYRSSEKDLNMHTSPQVSPVKKVKMSSIRSVSRSPTLDETAAATTTATTNTSTTTTTTTTTNIMDGTLLGLLEKTNTVTATSAAPAPAAAAATSSIVTTESPAPIRKVDMETIGNNAPFSREPAVTTNPAAAVSDVLASAHSRSSTFSTMDHMFAESDFAGDISVTILQARGLKPVDSNGSSDPFIKVIQSYHGKHKTIHKTAVVKKSLSPLWSKEIFSCKIPPARLKFVVKDHNLFGENKDLGEFDLDIMEQLLSGVAIAPGSIINIKFDRWFPITLGGTGEVHIAGEIKLLGK